MGLISLLRSWGSSVADGASRAVASFESRLEKSRELNRRFPRERGIGDRFFSSTMRGAGAYGFPGSWGSNRQVQVGEFRRWVHVAIDSICSETEGVNWQVGFVHAEDPTKGKSARRKRLPQNKGLKRFHGKALARKKLRDWRYNKSHHAIKPHEKVTPAGPDHPLVKLLTKPNVWDDGGQLFYELVLFLKLTGNAYLWVVPNQLNGLPCELWVIPSHWVFPHVGAGGIDYYEVRPLYGTGGGTLRIPEDEIIHFSCKNPLHKIDGFAPLQAGAEWVDVAQSIDTSRYWQFKNGAFAVGAIELGEKYDPDDQQIDAILAKFYARYQGETNTGKPIVMPPDAKYVPLTIAPQEMAYHDSAEQMRDWILALFRVPKEIAGIQDAGSEHAIYGPLLSFRIKAIIPLVRRIGNGLTRHLASRWDDHLRVWGEVPTTEDPAEVRAFAKQNLELGTGTINEYRAELGMEALDDPLADEVLVDPKRIPLSMLARQLEQQQQQAQMMQAMGGQPGAPGQPGQPPGQPGQKPPQPGADGQKQSEGQGGQAPDVSALGKQFLDDLLAGWNPDQDEPAPAKHFPVNRMKCDHGENQGLPGRCPEGRSDDAGHAEHHADAAPRAQSLASKLAELPGHVVRRVRQRVAEKYEQLESRYGKPTAIAVLAAGLAGTATPIPGGGLLAAAPILGAAELYLRLRGGGVAEVQPAKRMALAGANGRNGRNGRQKASFFSECDRDEGGHCKPGSGGGSSEGGKPESHGKPSEPSAPPAPASGENPTPREHYEREHAAWEARGEARERARTLMDRPNKDSEASENATAKIYDAHAQVEQHGAAGAKAAISGALEGWRGHWDAETELYKEAGATEAELRQLGRLRERAEAVLGRKAEAYQAAAEKFQAAWDAAGELEKAEPKLVEKEWPPEPEQPDPKAFADEEEFDKAYEAWEQAHDKWDEETQQIDEDNEEAYDAWAKEHDRWEAKYDRANAKIDAERDKLDEKHSDLTDALDEQHDKLSDAASDIETDIRERLDKEEEADEEPEEPDEDEEDEEDEEPEDDEDEDEEPRPAKSLHAARVKSLGGGGPEYDLLHDFPDRLLEVPDCRQRDDYSCGACVSFSAGRFFGVGPETLDEWKQALGTTEEASTRPQEIIDYLSSLGLQVEARQGMTLDDLRENWKRGFVTICPIQEYGVPSKQASEKFGHYVVVIGCALGFVFVQDPSADNVIEQERHPPTDGLPEELVNAALEFLHMPI